MSRASTMRRTSRRETSPRPHQALAAPFPGACIGYLPNRLGANSQWAAVFPYVDVTAIQDRLDLVVGPDRWSHEVSAIDGVTLGCGCACRRRALRDRPGHRPVVAIGERVQAVRASLWGGALPDPAAGGAAEGGGGDPGQCKGPAVRHRPAAGDIAATVREAHPGGLRSFGAILPHPGVCAGDIEGELPTHPEVEAGRRRRTRRHRARRLRMEPCCGCSPGRVRWTRRSWPT